MKDRPEYTQGDICEIYNPDVNAYQWIEVEEVLNVNGAQLIKGSNTSFICACLVNVDSLAMPEKAHA